MYSIPVRCIKGNAVFSYVEGKKGGALLSIIHSYSWHGAIAHTSLVSNMLSLTVKPLFGIISRWIYTGTLEDPYNEVLFDIQCNAYNNYIIHCSAAPIIIMHCNAILIIIRLHFCIMLCRVNYSYKHS